MIRDIYSVWSRSETVSRSTNPGRHPIILFVPFPFFLCFCHKIRTSYMGNNNNLRDRAWEPISNLRSGICLFVFALRPRSFNENRRIPNRIHSTHSRIREPASSMCGSCSTSLSLFKFTCLLHSRKTQSYAGRHKFGERRGPHDR